MCDVCLSFQGHTESILELIFIKSTNKNHAKGETTEFLKSEREEKKRINNNKLKKIPRCWKKLEET